jgi:hypothetical protein
VRALFLYFLSLGGFGGFGGGLVGEELIVYVLSNDFLRI